jgi:uncharacterized membrane protein
MSTVTTVYLLRIVHVAIGAIWVGTVVFIAAFLVPSIRAAGPAGGAVMRQLMQARRLPLWIMAAALLTVLSGLALYWRDSAGFQSEWLASGPARVYGLGAVCAILAVGVGVAVNSPSARRLGELSARVQATGRPPAPDEVAAIQRLQTRLGRGSIGAAVLLVLATVAMAVARYVP